MISKLFRKVSVDSYKQREMSKEFVKHFSLIIDDQINPQFIKGETTNNSTPTVESPVEKSQEEQTLYGSDVVQTDVVQNQGVAVIVEEMFKEISNSGLQNSTSEPQADQAAQTKTKRKYNKNNKKPKPDEQALLLAKEEEEKKRLLEEQEKQRILQEQEQQQRQLQESTNPTDNSGSEQTIFGPTESDEIMQELQDIIGQNDKVGSTDLDKLLSTEELNNTSTDSDGNNHD